MLGTASSHLAPLRDGVALDVATRRSLSIRTQFAWITVRVDGATGDAASVRAALEHLVTRLRHANGRKSEWIRIFSSLPLSECDVWDELPECGELDVRIRLVSQCDVAWLWTVLGLELSNRVSSAERRASRKTTLTSLRIAVQEPHERNAAQTTQLLRDLIELATATAHGTVWELEGFELDAMTLALDSDTLSLLEALSGCVSRIASLRIRVPFSWTPAPVASALRRIDSCKNVLSVTIVFANEAHVPGIVVAARDMCHIRRVRLERASARRRQYHVSEDVVLTTFFCPTASATSCFPQLDCADWSLNPVQVATWFRSPLHSTPMSPVTALDLALDTMTMWTLVAALDSIGPTLRTLVLRAKWRTAAHSVSVLPLGDFLLECPQLESLVVRGFRIDSLHTVVDRYAARETGLQSLALVGCHFDDGLTSGLLAVVEALTDPHSRMTRHLRELQVDPVLNLTDTAVEAIARMLGQNMTMELFVLQENGQKIPLLWKRLSSLHLQSPPTFYAFLSVVASPHAACEAVRRLHRDALATIVSWVGPLPRRKLWQAR